MTDKVRKLAPQIWAEIQKANNILLHCHRSPDPDSVGSALGMMHLLQSVGKRVTVIAGDSKIPESMSGLPGYETIVPKNYFQIDPKTFDLFVILDSSAPSQISKEGEVKFPETMRTVKIDHHMNDDSFADVNLVDTFYSSTAQIVYDLATFWKLKITPKAAACLFTGIYTDTGGFKYPPTNFETLLAASKLAKIYPDYFQIIFQLENSTDPKQLEFLSLALSHIKHYFSNKIALAAVSYEEMHKRSIVKEHTKNAELVNMLKSVPGWIMGISFLEHKPGMVELSMRRREFEGPDLSKLAIALGGGGHKSAAGASINKPFAEAKKYLLEMMKKTYPELGEP